MQRHHDLLQAHFNKDGIDAAIKELVVNHRTEGKVRPLDDFDYNRHMYGVAAAFPVDHDLDEAERLVECTRHEILKSVGDLMEHIKTCTHGHVFDAYVTEKPTVIVCDKDGKMSITVMVRWILEYSKPESPVVSKEECPHDPRPRSTVYSDNIPVIEIKPWVPSPDLQTAIVAVDEVFRNDGFAMTIEALRPGSNEEVRQLRMSKRRARSVSYSVAGRIKAKEEGINVRQRAGEVCDLVTGSYRELCDHVTECLGASIISIECSGMPHAYGKIIDEVEYVEVKVCCVVTCVEPEGDQPDAPGCGHLGSDERPLPARLEDLRYRFQVVNA